MSRLTARIQNKRQVNLGFEIFNVNTTSYQGYMISYSSNVDGVCKAFGHDKGIPGSVVTTDRTTGKGLVLDVTGSPISADEISSSSGYQIIGIACIDRK